MKSNRYIRQTLLEAIGNDGQEKLLDAHVVVVGCGGLGSIAAPYLAGAGIGKITLIDGDKPDITNLHRQVFFESKDYDSTKAEYLGSHIRKLNPEIELEVHSRMITKSNIRDFVQKANVVLECTDNIHVKYLVNDYCAIQRIPVIYGAIHKYDGYISFFENKDDESIHLRDVFAEPNEDIPSCSEVGVMGTLAGIIGLMQSNEAIKYISGAGSMLSSTLLTYNILTNDQLKLKLKKTYTENLKAVFEANSYIREVACATFEVTINELLSNRSKYDLISILEDHEHTDIDTNVTRKPLSSFSLEDWNETNDATPVFYCMSGIRSGKLVNEILALNPGSNALSLQGGLKAFKRLV